jgi:excinuclease UvrABC nuclease subunit
MVESSKFDGVDAALKEFVDRHIHGWSDQDWRALVASLSEEGHDVGDTGTIGLRLERAHILATLERLSLPGIGPRRREHVADHFPSLWALRNATVEQLTELPSFHRGLADTLHDGLKRRTGGF